MIVQHFRQTTADRGTAIGMEFESVDHEHGDQVSLPVRREMAGILEPFSPGWPLFEKHGDVFGRHKLPHHEASVNPPRTRSEEHTSELQSLMRISYAVFCLKKKNKYNTTYTQKQFTKLILHTYKLNHTRYIRIPK